MQIIKGIDYFPRFLNKEVLDDILQDIEGAVKLAPFLTPTMPKTGKSFSVKITNMGDFGWVSDKKDGYRYQKYHPVNNRKWPKISNNIIEIWQKLTGLEVKPDCCLINYYDLNAKMGLHIDNDEKNFSYPVLSISIGASALFRFAGLKRSDPSKSIKLHNGDVIILSGPARLIYHGIDKIYKDTNMDYRINLTLRKI